MSEPKTPEKPTLVAQPWRVDQPNEPDTGEHEGIATTGYVKRKIKAEEKTIFAKDVQWFVGGCLAAAALVLTSFLALDSRADDKVAKAEARSAEKLTKHETSSADEIAEVKKVVNTKASAAELAEVKHTVNRVEDKLDRMMERWNIPNPAPAPKDGGQ